jgi:hypothetical protein
MLFEVSREAQRLFLFFLGTVQYTLEVCSTYPKDLLSFCISFLARSHLSQSIYLSIVTSLLASFLLLNVVLAPVDTSLLLLLTFEASTSTVDCLYLLFFVFIIMTTKFTLGGIVFDTAAKPLPVVHGYSKSQRDNLTDDSLIKVYEHAVKSNLSDKLTKGLQVTTFNPSDMKDKNNFFVFVAQWQTVVLMMESHLSTYYMQSAFQLFKIEVTEVSSDAMLMYQGALLSHLTAIGAGAAAVPARPTEPVGVMSITGGTESILISWFSLSLEDVTKSVEAQIKFVTDKTHRQNLTWSFHYLMNCLDFDLKQYVLSKIDQYPKEIGQTGPVVFFVVAKRILHTTENLAQKVIAGFIALRLTHFEGESVVDCIFTIRNVLKFLRYGEANSFAPRTTVVMIYDVFRGCSVSSFKNYIQQLHDFQLGSAATPEKIFDKVQLKYEELLLADRWVPTKKQGSAFMTSGIKTYSESDLETGSSNGNFGGKQYGEKKKKKPTHDKGGKKIDYTPPKQGDPHKRDRADGVTEHWCGKCQRWGNHPTAEHDNWLKKFREDMKARREENSGSNSSIGSSSGTGTTRGSVSFLSALKNGTSALVVDSELVDGIDV